jgi:hypothetical protein
MVIHSLYTLIHSLLGLKDIDMGTMNPSYRLLSLVADLAKVMPMLLNAASGSSLLTPSTVREWLRLAFAWIDDLTEVGLFWEILKMRDSYGRS